MVSRVNAVLGIVGNTGENAGFSVRKSLDKENDAGHVDYRGRHQELRGAINYGNSQ